jgi:PTH1 family peptidyl-tRNA hydrolase
MNESGRSIRASLDWFGIEASQILVLVDDMDLPLGRLRLRAGGSAGGHNGLRSTISHLGTENFARLRIGIGAPSDDPQVRRQRTVSHVLGRFSDQERLNLSQVLEEVITGIDLIRAQGLERAGNRLNSFRLEPQPS